MTNGRSGYLRILMICFSVAISVNSAIKATEKTGKVTIVNQGVELIEVVPGAEKCSSKKGQTVRLRVTSDSAVDVRLYISVGYGEWLPKDFPNRKKGEEIIDYRCDRGRNYKVYVRAAGSTETWPKP